MATKDDVVNSIKEWLNLDRELKVLQKEVKTRREQKKAAAEALVKIMKENEIDCFDISEGKIIHTTNKSKAPLSKQHLLASLSEYFSETEVDTEAVGKFILDSRAIKMKDDIRHKPPKNM
jgi:predicted  nucleic acid-binding Zn-ribbon protein